MTAGVRFSDVSFAYAGQDAVLHGVDWAIDEGQFVLVAGESGSGKSTMLRCLNGLVPHFSGGRFGGEVMVHGFDTRRHGPRTLSASVGFVFQDPDAQRVSPIVEDELAFGMEQRGVPRSMMRKRVEEVLDLVGIAPLRHRDLNTLSGGERQRVAVAAALALQPRMLVLDEPTSQLDPWGADDVMTALERLNHELGLTVVLAEHRLERVVPLADGMRAITARGIIDGTPREVIAQLEDAMVPPVPRLGRAMEWTPIPLTVKDGRQHVRRLQMAPRAPDPRTVPARGPRVVGLAGVHASFGRRAVLRDVSIDFHAGEIVALMGRNGSGKTTLLRSLMGFHRPDRGTINVLGRNVEQNDPSDFAGLVGYLPQRPSSILFNETLRAELAFTLAHGDGISHEIDVQLIELDLLSLADRDPRDLSTGEQERAALAAVLVSNPDVLLLDEPTRGMDYRRKQALASLLRRRSDAGILTLIATHDVELVAECATRVVLLGDGEIIADGPPHEVLSGSLAYSTQINRLLGDGFLTVEDALRGFADSPRG